MAVVGELLAVGRERTPVAPVGRQCLLDAAAERHGVQARDAGIDSAARRGEDDATGIACPADDCIAGAVPGQPPGLAALAGDDENIVVAVPRRREGDPFTVRRERRGCTDGARCDGQASRFAAVFLDQPQIAAIAEDDFAVIIGCRASLISTARAGARKRRPGSPARSAGALEAMEAVSWYVSLIEVCAARNSPRRLEWGWRGFGGINPAPVRGLAFLLRRRRSLACQGRVFLLD